MEDKEEWITTYQESYSKKYKPNTGWRRFYRLQKEMSRDSHDSLHLKQITRWADKESAECVVKSLKPKTTNDNCSNSGGKTDHYSSCWKQEKGTCPQRNNNGDTNNNGFYGGDNDYFGEVSQMTSVTENNLRDRKDENTLGEEDKSVVEDKHQNFGKVETLKRSKPKKIKMPFESKILSAFLLDIKNQHLLANSTGKAKVSNDVPVATLVIGYVENGEEDDSVYNTNNNGLGGGGGGGSSKVPEGMEPCALVGVHLGGPLVSKRNEQTTKENSSRGRPSFQIWTTKSLSAIGPKVDTGLKNVSETIKAWTKDHKDCPSPFLVRPWAPQVSHQITRNARQWSGQPTYTSEQLSQMGIHREYEEHVGLSPAAHEVQGHHRSACIGNASPPPIRWDVVTKQEKARCYVSAPKIITGLDSVLGKKMC